MPETAARIFLFLRDADFARTHEFDRDFARAEFFARENGGVAFNFGFAFRLSDVCRKRARAVNVRISQIERDAQFAFAERENFYFVVRAFEFAFNGIRNVPLTSAALTDWRVCAFETTTKAAASIAKQTREKSFFGI
jgi:hypothetical protein